MQVLCEKLLAVCVLGALLTKEMMVNILAPLYTNIARVRTLHVPYNFTMRLRISLPPIAVVLVVIAQFPRTISATPAVVVGLKPSWSVAPFLLQLL